MCYRFKQKKERRFKFIATLSRLAVDGILYIRVEMRVVVTTTTTCRMAADLLLTSLSLDPGKANKRLAYDVLKAIENSRERYNQVMLTRYQDYQSE